MAAAMASPISSSERRHDAALPLRPFRVTMTGVRLILHALALCAAGGVLGLAGNSITPRPAPFGEPVTSAAEAPGAMCQIQGLQAAIPRISVEEATPLCVACTALFVDARTTAEYEAGHITGSTHIKPRHAADPVPSPLGV